MDSYHIAVLLRLSIEVEHGAACLYKLFAELYPEDLEFWSQLHLEEKSHATLLRTALDSFTKRGMLPGNIFATSEAGLRETARKVEVLLEKCKREPPARHDAFKIAIALENEAGEHHYNRFMGRDPESALDKVFQQLNRQDKDHEERIRNYLEGLSPKS